MIEYRNPDNNIVEISVEGKIAEADFDRVSSLSDRKLKKHGSGWQTASTVLYISSSKENKK